MAQFHIPSLLPKISEFSDFFFFFFVKEAYNNDVRNDERRLVRLRTVGWCERGCHNRRKYHESGYNKLSDFLTEIIHYK